MAEFANKRCEDMIPALEQMERIKLFDKTEISAIIKQFKNHELKLQRITKNKEDYLRYIQYQMDLVNLIKQRRLKFRIFQKKSDIEHSIYRKVNKIYEMLITRFKDDVRLYVGHIAFCKHRVSKKSCESTITRMLEVHPDKPECWHIAAKWEMKESKNLDTARSYIMRGIHLHPKSQLLYADAFKMELNAGDKNEKNSETEENENPIKTKRALAVYRSASKNVGELNFVIELLNIAKQYENTKELQNNIIFDMIKKYNNEPQMWDVMAKRELEGLSYSIGGDESMEIEGEKEEHSLRDRIESCNEVYRTAIDRLQTTAMWSLYIDNLIKLNKKPTLPKYKRKLLKNALMQAHEAGKLEEKYYLHWIGMLNNGVRDEISKSKIYQVANFGTEAIPESVTLWYEKLKYLMNWGKDDLVQEEFKKASEILGIKALPLWQMKLIYYKEKFPEKLGEFFSVAVNQDPVISIKMKSAYLEWLVQNEGIQAARNKYQELTGQPPTCLDMHKKMAELETLQPKICVENARKPHELASMQFGKTHIEVWVDYMLFEMVYGDPIKTASIYQRAVKTLEPSKINSFVEEWSLIKTTPGAIERSERL